MELRVLNYFLAIAREENITKAAQTLHVTQPTLSRQIAQLEEELGVKLFVRSNHNISLTEDGMILKRRAQEIISLADKTKKDFMNKEETLSGEIAIGSGEFQSTRFLSRLIAAFKEKYPLVRYEIYSGNTGNIQDNIERGLLDIGLINEPVDIRKYDFVSTSQKEKWGIMVKKDSELAGKESIRPDELIGYPLIIPSGDFIKSFIEKWFGEYASQMNTVAAVNLQYNGAMMVENDVGVLMCIKLNSEYKNLRFIPLSPAVEAGTALAWKKEQIFSPATAAFIEFAKLYSKGIPDYKL